MNACAVNDGCSVGDIQADQAQAPIRFPSGALRVLGWHMNHQPIEGMHVPSNGLFSHPPQPEPSQSLPNDGTATLSFSDLESQNDGTAS